MRKTLLLLFIYAAAAKAGDIVLPPITLLVGTGEGACTYTDIQEALDDASPGSEIRITSENTHSGPFQVSQSVTIKGGYSSCGLAQLDSRLDGNRTTITGNNSTHLMTVTGDDLTVDISGITFESGQGADSILAGGSLTGGIYFNGERSEYQMTNVDINANVGFHGGGILIDGSSNFFDRNKLVLDRTRFFGNEAVNGGGIYCSGAHITLDNGSGIASNNATESGGGIYAVDCHVSVLDGEADEQAALVGISSNTAVDFGGGMFLDDSDVIFGGEQHNFKPVNIDNNIANLDRDNTGGGGAIYATNGSAIVASSGYFYNNTSFHAPGGAVYLDDSLLSTALNLNACIASHDRCAWFERNHSIRLKNVGGEFFGGAIYASNNALVGDSLSHPFRGTFVGNYANNGTAMFLDSGTKAWIQNSYFIDNHHEDANNVTLIWANGSATEVNIQFSTLARNETDIIFDIDGGAQLRFDQSITHEDVLIESDVLSLTPDSDFFHECSIFHEGDSIDPIPPTSSSIIHPNPGFVDPDSHDYHLLHNSIAVDFCNELDMDPADIHPDRDSDDRPFDVPNVDNGDGSYDAGADEYNDIIFINGFENNN